MTDPLSVSASMVAVTTAAIGTVKFLYTTIRDMKDVPPALENITSDLQAVELILQQLRMISQEIRKGNKTLAVFVLLFLITPQ